MATNVAKRVKELSRLAAETIKSNKFQNARPIIDELLRLDNQEIALNLSVAKNIVGIAGTLLPTQDHKRLEQLFLKALNILQNHKDAKAGDVLVAMNNLATLYDQCSDYRERDRINSFIVDVAKNQVETPGKDSMYVFLQLAPLYEKAGYGEPAAILYKQGIRHLLEHISDFPPDLPPDTMVRYANSLLIDGKYTEAQEVLDRFSKDDHRRRAMILGGMGGHALAKGKLDSAEEWLKQSIFHANQLGEKGTAIIGKASHNLASLYLQKESHLNNVNKKQELMDEAWCLMKQSLEIAEKAGLQRTADYAGGLGQLALIAIKKGDPESAEHFYTECFMHYENVADENNVEFADFLTDGGFFYLSCEKPSDACRIFKRAHNLRAAMQGLPPWQMTHTISNLALAHFKAGEFKEANTLYTEAIEMRHTQEAAGQT